MVVAAPPIVIVSSPVPRSNATVRLAPEALIAVSTADVAGPLIVALDPIENVPSVSPATEETVKNREHFVYQEGQPVFKAAVTGMADVSAEIMEKITFNLKMFLG